MPSRLNKILVTTNEAFEILTTAVKERRAVVPLFGTGMSADAGMPLGPELTSYLVQVHAMIRALGQTEPQEFLLRSRWPSRHELRLQLMQLAGKSSLRTIMQSLTRIASQDAMTSELRRSSPTLAASIHELLQKSWGKFSISDISNLTDHQNELRTFQAKWKVAAIDELAAQVPSSTGYRSLLFHLTQNNQALHDACLDHFMREREPSTTHQFIVFLARILSCKVILTTNFDRLIEEAFADDNVTAKVYELQGETTIPLPQLLLSQQMSIIKLHGGAHQMRLGFDLDDPLPSAVRSSFGELFSALRQKNEKPPLLLVMSYCQKSWMNPETQAASFSPSLKIAPAITAGSNVLPLSFRQ